MLDRRVDNDVGIEHLLVSDQHLGQRSVIHRKAELFTEQPTVLRDDPVQLRTLLHGGVAGQHQERHREVFHHGVERHLVRGLPHRLDAEQIEATGERRAHLARRTKILQCSWYRVAYSHPCFSSR